MKIKLNGSNQVKDVFVIYWTTDSSMNFYVLNDSKTGFNVETDGKTCSIHNTSLDGFVLDSGEDGIIGSLFHKALIKHNLSDQITDYAINADIYYDNPITELNRRLRELYFSKNDEETKYLPIDAVCYSDQFPNASDYLDGFHFCPNCCDAHQPLHEYDEAICCPSCNTLFNLVEKNIDASWFQVNADHNNHTGMYSGLTLEAAKELAQKNNITLIVSEIDGMEQKPTKDLSPGGINAIVENGVVVSYGVEW